MGVSPGRFNGAGCQEQGEEMMFVLEIGGETNTAVEKSLMGYGWLFSRRA